MQIERNGKKQTFSVHDLGFLKEIQEQVIEYVEFLFYQRSREMEKEVERWNNDLIQVDGDPELVASADHVETFDSLEEFNERINEVRKRAQRSAGRSASVTYLTPSTEFILEHDALAKYNPATYGITTE